VLGGRTGNVPLFPGSVCFIKNIMDDGPKRSRKTAVVKSVVSCLNCIYILYSECLWNARKQNIGDWR
jgi:hypothetical protein